jgi:hypothetical protein
MMTCMCEATTPRLAVDMPGDMVEAVYKLTSVVTHSLKGAWFQPSNL